MDSKSKKILVSINRRVGGLPSGRIENYELIIPKDAELTTGEANKQLAARKVTDYLLIGPMLVGPALKPGKPDEDPQIGDKEETE